MAFLGVKKWHFGGQKNRYFGGRKKGQKNDDSGGQKSDISGVEIEVLGVRFRGFGKSRKKWKKVKKSEKKWKKVKKSEKKWKKVIFIDNLSIFWGSISEAFSYLKFDDFVVKKVTFFDKKVEKRRSMARFGQIYVETLAPELAFQRKMAKKWKKVKKTVRNR